MLFLAFLVHESVWFERLKKWAGTKVLGAWYRKDKRQAPFIKKYDGAIVEERLNLEKLEVDVPSVHDLYWHDLNEMAQSLVDKHMEAGVRVLRPYIKKVAKLALSGKLQSHPWEELAAREMADAWINHIRGGARPGTAAGAGGIGGAGGIIVYRNVGGGGGGTGVAGVITVGEVTIRPVQGTAITAAPIQYAVYQGGTTMINWANVTTTATNYYVTYTIPA
jgi:hypothetical protein